MTPYPEKTEQMMRKFYNTLDEKERRRYAAMEAIKLGHGGIGYIAFVLEVCRDTIKAGIKELQSLDDNSDSDPSIRQGGGGRKPLEQTIPTIDKAFLDVVQNHTAGDPMNDEVLWTNLTHAEIETRLEQDHGITVSETVVIKLLKKHKFKKRKAQKKKR